MNSKFISTLAAATTLAGIVATAGTANAASLSYTASSGDYSPTDFSETLSIQKFDSSLGTLTSVFLEITGSIKANAGLESLSASSSTITANVGADMYLTQDNNQLFFIKPTNSESYQATAFDGQIDFSGTSGKTINDIMDSEYKNTTLTSDLYDLAAYIGSGNIDFLFSATAKSSVSGSGNIVSQINTNAKGTLKVTYNYDSPYSTQVPEPSTLLGFGLVAGFGMLSQRKKSRFQISK
ncbi:PEP-CTERM sorting domain-containing protein [Anabaena sp. PCC 7108]|uniref:PEP-CTERM sorting domain-containing protein n=1 Tax=Anabaena sp. PCC 7108 TaxID=163908 RepID=UPI00034D21DA|nr:PEP-CTERM sorting domain-containing protein [Anabaena sp. PCC 7108]